MEIYLNLNDLPRFKKPMAAAIGNFDGVHIGHQHILKLLLEISQQHDYLSLVITFFPHPGTLMHPDRMHLIQTLNQRLDEIAQFGIDKALVIPFDRNFAGISPSDFVENILHRTLHAGHIIVGSNFKFGKNRSGSVDTLKELSSPFNISIHMVSPVMLNQEPVSSSRIRRFLAAGRIEKANRYLGKPYRIQGRIVKGQSRGRTLGFPTANLLPENEILPEGVFISRSYFNGYAYHSLTNIGIRPTFQSEERKISRLNVETYLINNNSPLYGKLMTLELLKKIRDEKHFRNPLDLKIQIQKDLKNALLYFDTQDIISRNS
jgi:riboflavin kinase / FMN adenylyltransferase